MNCPTFQARDPMDVIRRLLEKDGIDEVVPVGSRNTFAFCSATTLKG